VNLTDKKHRRNSEPRGGVLPLRPLVQAIADRYNARVQVAEIPPGPPVLSTLVFEVYGPTTGFGTVCRKTSTVFAPARGDSWTWTPTSLQRNRWTFVRGSGKGHVERAFRVGSIAQTASPGVGRANVGTGVHRAWTRTLWKFGCVFRRKIGRDLDRGGEDQSSFSQRDLDSLWPNWIQTQRVERDPPIYHKNLTAGQLCDCRCGGPTGKPRLRRFGPAGKDSKVGIDEGMR
jgi:hypothetical protein